MLQAYLTFHCLLLSFNVISSINVGSSVILDILPFCFQKKRKKNDLGKYRQTSLPHFVGKPEKNSFSKYFQAHEEQFRLGKNQREFSGGKSYPSDMPAFCEMPGFIGK